MDPPSMESGRFIYIKIWECDSHFVKDDLCYIPLL